MSIFASRTQRTVEIPFDPPHTCTIQRLPGRHLQAAKEASQLASVEALRRLGGTKFQEELGRLGNPDAVAAIVAEKQADPLTGYDRGTVLVHGIKAWTYEEPVSAETIDDLTEEAADFLARAIVGLAPARDEGGRKNGSGASTSS